MKGLKKCFFFFSALICSVFVCFLVTSYPVNALEGHIDFDSSSMSYFWVWNNNGAEQWNSPTLGVPFTEGYWPVNGLTFNLTLDNGINYGSYTNGKINFTLAGSGNWAVDGGNLSNVKCEGWTAPPHQLIPCTMNISKSYYQSSTFDSSQNIVQYAVDYQLNFVADNKKPSYVFIRIGNNRNNDLSIIPIINGLNSGNTARTRPMIRNASYDYSTSDDSSSSAQLNQIIDNTSDLINGQKVIDNSINHPEWREEERQELQDATEEVDSRASDIGNDISESTNSIIDTARQILEVLKTPASDCFISVTTGSNGVLKLNNLDLCRAPNEILGLIQAVAGLVITVSILWTCYSIFLAIMSLINEFFNSGGTA